MLLLGFLEAQIVGSKEGFSIVQVNEDSLEEFLVLLRPPSGIYSGQYQILRLCTSYGSNERYQYPKNPPSVKFVTKVYHTNVSSSGSICVDILKDSKAWMPTYRLADVIMNIVLLYLNPNTSDPFNGEASRGYTDCEKRFKSMRKKGMSYQDEEKIREECFAGYVAETEKVASKNDMKPYEKYFPVLRLHRINASKAVWEAHEKTVEEQLALAKESLERLKPKNKAKTPKEQPPQDPETKADDKKKRASKWAKKAAAKAKSKTAPKAPPKAEESE